MTLKGSFVAFWFKETMITTSASYFNSKESGPRFTKVRKNYEFVRPIV